MFNPVGNNHVNQTLSTIGSVSLREQKVYEEKVTTATISQLGDSAVANSHDLSLVFANVSAVYDLALDRAKKISGKTKTKAGKTMAEAFALAEITKIHVNVFTDLLRQNPAEAEEYLKILEKNEGTRNVMRMDPAELSKLEEQAETRTRVVLAQDIVDELDSSDILGPLALKTKKQKAMWNLKTRTPEARAAKGDLADPYWQKVARNFVQKNFEGKDETAISEELEKRIRQAVQNKGFRRDQAASAAYRHVFGLDGAEKKSLKSFLSDPANKEHAELLGHVSMAPFLTFLRKETGKIEFRTHSDNETFAALRSNLSVLAQTDLEIKRGDLTKGEHDKLVNLKAGELAKLKLIEQGQGQILKDGATFVSKAAPKGWPTHKAHRHLVQEAEGEMRVWIGNYVKQHTALPSYELMRREATRMWLKIKADPENTGTLAMPEEGEEEITLRAFQADNLYALSPQQRGVARVSFSQLSDAFKEEIREDVKEHFRDQGHAAPDTISDSLSEEDYETLAAATLLNDGPRILKYMKFLAGQ